MSKPVVLLEGQAVDALVRGYVDLAELLALTLGPTQGHVLHHRERRAPELIEDSASIARRIIDTPGRAANVGAMLMRNAAWRLHSRAGDGVATSAVLSQAILRGATRYVRAGGSPTLVKRGIERGLLTAADALSRQARPVKGEEELTRLALTITGEPAVSLLLGEMLDVLGPDAHITVEDYAAPNLERAYLDGGRWRAAVASPYLITDAAGRRAVLEDCRVALCTDRINAVADVEPLLSLLAKSQSPRLLLVANEISGQALSTLLINHDRGTFKTVAVSLRSTGEDRANDYADLAVLTGATVFGAEYGRLVSRIEDADLGSVRRAEATADELVVRGGGGDPAALRALIDGLRSQEEDKSWDASKHASPRVRLARLAGGAGILKVGAHTPSEREALHQKAEKAIRALQPALQDGVVPGGGAAFLWAIAPVRSMAETLSGDERQGALVLAQALEEPFRRIVKNRGGAVPAAALAELNRSGPGYAYDALSDSVVLAEESGLEDPVFVSRAALEVAVSGAVSALSVAVTVLRRKPWKELGAS